MPKPTISQNTGNAPIDRQGQTTNGFNGSDPNMKAVRRGKVRDLRP